MAGASGGALASEVSLAGGFGFLAPVYTGVEKFRDEFDIARSILNRPTGPLPIGAGFLGWKLEEVQSPHIALLELALENGVRAIWLSFGEHLGRWIGLVRNHDEKSGKSPKTLIFLQVNSVEEALVADRTWKVDVLVAQGKRTPPSALLLLLLLLLHHSSHLMSPLPPSFQASNRADTVHLPLHQSSISSHKYCPPFRPQGLCPCSPPVDFPAAHTSPRS